MVACAPTACKHRVSGSLSLPSRGPFHLSLTVLYAIGHQVVFSLRRWSSHIHTGFHVSCATLDTRQLKSISSTRLLLCFVQLSRSVQLLILCIMQVRTPSEQAPQVWAHSLSLTTTYEIVDLLSFPPGTKMFQFPGFPSYTLCVQVWIPQHNLWWVPPFGNLRIVSHLHFPVAYRSLSRPSSAPSAKASTLRSS